MDGDVRKIRRALGAVIVKVNHAEARRGPMVNIMCLKIKFHDCISLHVGSIIAMRQISVTMPGAFTSFSHGL